MTSTIFLDTSSASPLEAIAHRRRQFDDLVSQGHSHLARGNLEAAAIFADIADEFASWSGHCGFFASEALEGLLTTIGRRSGPDLAPVARCAPPKRILHVVWGVWSRGGHSRFLWRWIAQDRDRQHSVILTRMQESEAPGDLSENIHATGGRIYTLAGAGYLARAAQLRRIAHDFDLVVLHSIYDGATAVIALAEQSGSPPCIYVNHADERHWCGASISRVVANLRTSGRQLSLTRRGIDPDRNLLLPTLIDLPERKQTRADAKAALGIDPRSVLLVSIARAAKFRPSDGSTFVRDHLDALKANQRLTLAVVGPGKAGTTHCDLDLADRIRLVPETPETQLYYQAADIYVDSSPFVSITSLLEAGSYGTPLVSRYPFTSSDCEVLGADMPGLDGTLVVTTTHQEYTSEILRLAADSELRENLGDATREQISRFHAGPGWQAALERIYHSACSHLGPDISLQIPPPEHSTALDFELDGIVPYDRRSVDCLITNRLTRIPVRERLRFWSMLLRQGNFGRFLHLSAFAPHWAVDLLRKGIA